MIDNLRKMAVFAEVVEAGGFAPAARVLGLSRSAVQKQVALLEAELGVRLLERTTRRTRLTEAGRALAPTCAQLVALASLGVRHARVHAEVPIGRLVVTASLGVGERWLGPKLASFTSAFPEVALDLRLEERNVDLLAEGVDIALRAGALPDSDLVARKLAEFSLVAVASPRLLESQRIETVHDLRDMPWIVYAPMGPRVPLTVSGVTHVLTLPERLVVNNGTVILALARAGVGAAMLPDFWVADAVRDGSLLPVLPRAEGPRVPLHAVLPHRDMPLTSRVFVDHISA